MIKIGLTGGIGSGKTTVLGLFSKFGASVICLDDIAKALVEPKGQAYSALKTHFGKAYFLGSGQLNRAKLREHVFTHQPDRTWLEALLHPLIRQELKKQLSQLNSPYCIIEIPLLVETNFKELVDRTLVIDCPESDQIARIQKRDGVQAASIQAIIDTQATRAERLAIADDVIENDGPLKLLEGKVLHLENQYNDLHLEGMG